MALNDDTVPRGPGWYESSWELGQGLVVREGAPSQAGLEEWLVAYLDGPTQPPSRRRTLPQSA